MTHHPAMIARYTRVLKSKGHSIGPRCGMLVAVDGIWRTHTWMCLQCTRAELYAFELGEYAADSLV